MTSASRSTTKVGMRHTFLAATVLVAVGAIMATASWAGPPPPPPPFSPSGTSATPPVAGRTFTWLLLGHRPASAAWKFSCSAAVRGHAVVTQRQEFGLNPWGDVDMRSCALHVPPRAGGSVLTITANASDRTGNTFQIARRLRIFRHANMTAVSAGPPQPGVIYDTFLSQTGPVAGRSFTAVIVQNEIGGPWTFKCSASLHGHRIVVHRQEFGDSYSVPDIRTCGFQVPRRTARQLLSVTADGTTPDGQAFHATRTWRIVGRT